MIKIGIITFQNGYNRGACDFYPLIKWRKELRSMNVEISFFNSHEDKKLLRSDIVGIDSRYYRELTVVRETFPDSGFIIEAIDRFKSKGIKVVLFDNDDSSGGRQWDMIPHVDTLVKKQVLNDREYYTKNYGLYSYKPFVKSYDIETSNDDYEYTQCPADQLNKIKIGWNIGMKDYRYFPFSYYYPIGTSRLLNNIYKTPKFRQPSADRPYNSVFRGEVKKNNEVYSYQRNRVIELFTSEPSMISGGIVSKRRYMQEMKNSKIIVSPFGWGEVCYRDFEAIMSGALLVKPSMEHLETYPNIYKKEKTYVPIRWDMNDLEETLYRILDSFEDYLPIIRNAQNQYKKALNDSNYFIDHFLSILDLDESRKSGV